MSQGNEETRCGFLESPKHMAMLRAVFSQDVFIPKQRAIKATVKLRSKNLRADKRALIDSGTTSNFIDPTIANRFQLPQIKLPRPRIIRNIDGTQNTIGSVSHAIALQLRYGTEHRDQCFYVIDLGRDDIILRYPFLAAANPNINWTEGTFPGEVTLSTHDANKWNPDRQQKYLDKMN
jgi:hypothetical protein